MSRARGRNSSRGLEAEARFENEDLAFHERVRQGYLALAGPGAGSLPSRRRRAGARGASRTGCGHRRRAAAAPGLGMHCLFAQGPPEVQYQVLFHIDHRSRTACRCPEAGAGRTEPLLTPTSFQERKGVGKKMTALALAATVNCGQAGPEGGCGECPVCRRTAAGTHPDVHLVMPESENEQLLAAMNAKEAGKASSEIKIDQIRRAQESISLTPSEGSKKFLDRGRRRYPEHRGTERLPENAGGTARRLGHHPGRSRPQSLLATIRSRCQEIRFLPLSRQQLAAALEGTTGAAESDAWFLAALAQGQHGPGAGDGHRAGEKGRAAGGAGELWSALPDMSPAEVLARAEAFCKDRERFERLLDLGSRTAPGRAGAARDRRGKTAGGRAGRGPAPGVGRAVLAAAAAQGHGAFYGKPQPAREAGGRAACSRASADGAGELTPRRA